MQKYTVLVFEPDAALNVGDGKSKLRINERDSSVKKIKKYSDRK